MAASITTTSKWQGDWVQLCNDPRWMYCGSNSGSSNGSGNNQQEEKEEEQRQQQEPQPLMFVKSWDSDDIRTALISEIIPAPPGMHRGALAPAWVFQVVEKLFQEEADDMPTYQRRLLSFLCGRFVVISRPDASNKERLEASNGIPQSSVRYWWRYWDNQGNVYEVKMEKWRRHVSTTTEPQIMTTVPEGALPGDFSTETTWLRDQSGYDFMSDMKFGPIITHLSTFFEEMWFWQFNGTTYCDSWDQSLTALEESAGIPH